MSAKLPPGPSLLATPHLLLGLRRDVLTTLSDLKKEHGDLVLFRLGWRNVVLVSRPDHVSAVFSAARGTYSRDTYMNSLAKRVLGRRGLIANDGDIWLRQRRMLRPVFSPTKISEYHEVVVQETSKMFDEWEAAAKSGETLDVSTPIANLALRITSRALFGMSLKPSLERAIHDDFLALNEDLTWRLTSSLPLPPVLPTSRDRRWRSAMSRLDGALEELIKESRNELREGGDLLSLLVRARDDETGAAMVDEEVRDHVKTFLLGGYETTAHALSWALYLLSTNPNAAAALQKEVDYVLSARQVSELDLTRLPVARAAFEETLRLYPPGWMTARRTEVATELGGYTIPKGTDMFICMYLLHRDERTWSDPERFSPERFFGAEPPRGSFLPFGGGPQACIGRGLAMVQGQTFVAMFAQRFESLLAPSHRTAVEPLLTLRSRYGVHLQLRQRANSNCGSQYLPDSQGGRICAE